MNQVAKVDKAQSPAATFRDQWTKQEQEITAALPPHIPVERFMRVVMTAVSASPDLLAADRRSLFESSMKAAQDGLLPDGRDGALVIFNAKVKDNGKDVWIKKVQWMPMVGGILKKIRNSGELLTISAYVAYEKDEFEYTLGDEESIVHRPCLEEDRGRPRLVYAVAKTKDGGVYREIMTFKDVEKVRGVSRAKDSGPWKDWWDEMAKKTVIRRLAKRLPMSSDLDDLIRRDDDLYDFQGKRADMEDMRRQLQAPNLQDRLREAREASQEATGKREGFDRDFVRAETETVLTGEIIDNSEPDDGASSLAQSSDADSSSSGLSATEGDGAAVSPSGAPSPSSNLTAEDRRDLMECCAKLMFIAVDPDLATPNSKRGVLETSKNAWKAKLRPELHEHLKSFFLSADAVIKGEADRAAAISEFAHMLECAPEDIGGDT